MVVRADMRAVPPDERCGEAVSLNGGVSELTPEWITPQGMDRRALAAWCRTVGPAVVGALPSLLPGGSGVDELVVVTWNTHVGGGDLITLVDHLRRGDLTGGTGVSHFVLLLQEVYRGGAAVPSVSAGAPVPGRILPVVLTRARIDVTAAAQRLGLAMYFVPSMRNGGNAVNRSPEDRGNAILSTLPLSDLRAIELPFERQRRVAVAATITGVTRGGAGWSLRVASAHLDNLAGARRLWIGAPAARARQATGLLESLPADLPLVLGGDFNVWFGAWEPAYRVLKARFGDGRVATGATFGPLSLDHVFFGVPADWGATGRRVRDRFGSDHHPIVATITMAGSSTSR